jgi:carbonic anhydrase
LYDLRVGLVENWIRHVQDVRRMHQEWLDTVPEPQRVDALCELNVLEQARNACHTTVVQDAWARGQEIVVHGWVYGLHNGLLEDLQLTAACAEDVEPAYRLALGRVKQRYAAAA